MDQRSYLIYWLSNLFVQVYDAKKIIEKIEHADIYPATEQKLIHRGEVLEDETTFTENNITEDSSIVMMHSEVLHYMFYISTCNM